MGKESLHIPGTIEEAHAFGWDELDVVLVTGDPHIDHPSFPGAIIARVLLDRGFRVAVISRPDPSDYKSVMVFGLPRLFFGVTSGSLDSMVANYTAQKRRRSDDPYGIDGKGGGRPDRALTVYCNLIRQAYGKAGFIVGGGIEASLRRFAHYDFWSDSVRRPILMDCGADILVHGMGEGPVVAIAKALDALMDENSEVARAFSKKRKIDPGIKVGVLRKINGVVYREAKSISPPDNAVGIPSSEDVAGDAVGHIKAHKLILKNREKVVWQESGGMRVIVNPPWPSLLQNELDRIFELPFSRDKHPIYKGKRIPALEQVRFSVTSHRGCFGGCSFCAIGALQGKTIVSRSVESIIKEIEKITAHSDFKGIINDVGGPSANMYRMKCKVKTKCGRASCLYPEMCEKLEADQSPYLNLLRRASSVKGVKRLFVTTGIRVDLACRSSKFIEELARKHTSGYLKVAPEHVSQKVLNLMGKNRISAFERFLFMFRRFSEKAGKKQFLLPYFMAAHPGSDVSEMMELNRFLKDHKLKVEQCQIFTPTPGTTSTVMYATGLNPKTGKEVFVEKDSVGKEKQKELILHHLNKNRQKEKKISDFETKKTRCTRRRVVK